MAARKRTERQPRERGETIRQAILAALREHTLTARELSVMISIPEDSVAEHLEHLGRSLSRSGERLLIEPARCQACDFLFQARRRPSRPSRCPACKSERIAPPLFHVGAA